MKKIIFLLLAMTATAHASATRISVFDTAKSSDLSKSFTLPGTSDQFAGATVANHGTGATSFTTNGMLFGNSTSPLGVTAAGSQYQVFQAGGSGVPSVGALHLDQSAAVTGTLPFGNGGTGQSSYTDGQLLIGNTSTGGISKSTLTSGSNITITNGNGSITIAASAPAPAVNGGSSGVAVTAGGGISISSIGYYNFIWVTGSGGAVTITATPSITACTADAQKLTVIGLSNTNTVTLQDQANLASSGLSMNGNAILAKDSVIEFHCDITQGLWVEDNRR